MSDREFNLKILKPIKTYVATVETDVVLADGQKIRLPKAQRIRFGSLGGPDYWDREVQPLIDDGTLVEEQGPT